MECGLWSVEGGGDTHKYKIDSRVPHSNIENVFPRTLCWTRFGWRKRESLIPIKTHISQRWYSLAQLVSVSLFHLRDFEVTQSFSTAIKYCTKAKSFCSLSIFYKPNSKSKYESLIQPLGSLQ